MSFQEHSWLSYLLVSGFQVLALTLPPFPGRAAIFAPLIIASAYQTYVNPVSDDAGLIITLNGLNQYYLTTIARLM